MARNPYLDLPDDDQPQSSSNPYLDLPDDNKIQPHESIFQKALKSIGGQASQLFMPNQDQGLMRFAGPTSLPWQKQPNSPGGMMDVIGQTGGETVSDTAEIKNPLARGVIGAALDPRSWVVGGKAASGVASGAKTTARSLMNPSKVFGEALESSKGKVNFLDVIAKHSDDPIVKKVLDKSEVIEKYGGTKLGEGGSVTERLANLTPKESQEIINAVKVGQNKAMLSGDVVKSNKVNLSKFFSDLSKAQNAGVEGIKGAKRLYGFSKNVGRAAKSTAGKVATGSILGASAKTAYDFLK